MARSFAGGGETEACANEWEQCGRRESEAMQYRELGKTGWKVSAIGMGCWGIGGQWGPVEEREAIATVHKAMDYGITLFDTADAYGLGESERRLGLALRNRREKATIATKVGNFARRLGEPLSYATPHHVYLCCDASLHRLQTDTIDLYQCHIGNLTDASVFLEAFETLQQQGKIRAFGISTDNPEVVKQFDRDGHCAAVQLNYSILSRGAEKALLPLCAERNIGVLVRGPLAKGVLAGKFTPESTFDDSVRSGWNTGEERQRFLRDLERVEKLRFLARDGRTMAQAALQFVIGHPAVTCAIPGAKSPTQAEQNARAADSEITNDERRRIEEAMG
jgi:aryl-alcohol dehydrogenase-like predicted oxidoreductase